MKRLTLGPFFTKHAMQIYAQGMTEPIGSDDLENWAERNESDGPSRTLSYHGEPVGCFGIRIYWPHVGEAWVILTKDIEKYCGAHIQGKRIFEQMIEEFDLHRVGAFLRTDRPEFVRYAEYMGFEREGECRKFFPDGTNCYMYARVR